MKVVNQPIMKKDAMALVTGKPVFTNDKAPKECLIVKLLRSPYANAMIKSINTQFAMKVPGIEAIYTWEDVPQERFTMAGQTYPELSPYDRQILDQHVRYVGDPVAIVAGENEKCVDQAIKMLRVEYEVLPANLDPRKAMDKDTPLVHPEDNWKALCNIGADNKKNLCATEETHEGDVDAFGNGVGGNIGIAAWYCPGAGSRCAANGSAEPANSLAQFCRYAEGLVVWQRKLCSLCTVTAIDSIVGCFTGCGPYDLRR